MYAEINEDFLFNLKKSDNKSIIDWCMNNGLIASAYKCFKCGRRMKLSERKDSLDGSEWRCRTYGVDGHEVRRSVREGSWFNESKLDIVDILLITYYWINKFTIDSIIKKLELNTDAVIDWINFCREICMEICIQESCVLGGKNVTIEILKTKINNRKMIKIKGDRRNCIICGIENCSNKLFLCLVDSISKDMLLETILNYVLPGSTIVSELWKAYNCYDDNEFLDTINSESLCLKDADSYLTTIKINEDYIELENNSMDTLVDHQSTETVPQSEIKNITIDNLNICLAEILWRRRHNNEVTMEYFLDALLSVYPPRKED